MIGLGSLVGIPKYASPAGGNGTVTLDKGGILVSILVHASAGGATLTIFGGPAIPIPNGANPTPIQFFHTLYEATSANSGAIVGTNTDMLDVHWINPGHVKP